VQARGHVGVSKVKKEKEEEERVSSGGSTFVKTRYD
jgi:hypothetical protein